MPTDGSAPSAEKWSEEERRLYTILAETKLDVVIPALRQAIFEAYWLGRETGRNEMRDAD